MKMLIFNGQVFDNNMWLTCLRQTLDSIKRKTPAICKQCVFCGYYSLTLLQLHWKFQYQTKKAIMCKLCGHNLNQFQLLFSPDKGVLHILQASTVFHSTPPLANCIVPSCDAVRCWNIILTKYISFWNITWIVVSCMKLDSGRSQ